MAEAPVASLTIPPRNLLRLCIVQPRPHIVHKLFRIMTRDPPHGPFGPARKLRLRLSIIHVGAYSVDGRRAEFVLFEVAVEDVAALLRPFVLDGVFTSVGARR